MQTLGDVITAGLILMALIVVPYKIAKAWLWPALMSRWTTGRRLNSAQENAHDRRFLPVKGNGETAGNGVAIGEMAGNDPFPFPDLFTGLARIVLDKKLGETDAIKIAIKVTPGRGIMYLEARRRLHAAMERESPSSDPRFRQSDGSTAPASHPVSKSA